MKKGNNNVMRRLVSVILVVFMIFSMLPSAAFAGEVTEITQTTEAATEAPTEATTEATTEAATEAPTEVTTEAATEATTEEPTSDLVEAPTDAPVEEPTSGSEEATTGAEQEESTEATEEETSEAPRAEGLSRIRVAFTNGKGIVVIDNKVATYVDVEPGVTVDVKVSAPEGYYIDSVSVNGINEQIDELAATYSTAITATEEDTTISVTFAKKSYKVSVTVGENGTVLYDGAVVEGPVEVEYESRPEFLIVADDGYIVSEVSFNKNPRNPYTSSSFRATQEGLVYTADPVEGDSVIEVQFKAAEAEIVENVLETEYFTITFAPDTEPVAVLDIDGCKTIILPKDGTATFEPAGEYKDGYISLNNGTLAKSVQHTGKLTDITVSKSTFENDCRYKQLKVNCEILIDDTVEKAEVVFPDKENDEKDTGANPFYASADLNGIRIMVPTDISGLQEVSYEVSVHDDHDNVTAVVQHGTLLGNEDPAKDILAFNDCTSEYACTINLSAGKVNQKKNVKLTVTVTDKAGNKEETVRELIVNKDAPQVSVEIDGKVNDNATLPDHYKAAEKGQVVRTATITIRDWAETFNKEAAEACVTVNAYKSEYDKTPIEDQDAYTITWQSTGNIHTCTIQFIGDAYYEWSFGEYKNKVGLVNPEVKATATDGTDNIFAFTCDTTAPTATFNIGSLFEKLWENTVGHFITTEQTVSIEDEKDNISKIDNISVHYYVLEDAHQAAPLGKSDLDNIFDNPEDNKVKTDPVKILTNSAVVVYARIMDGAGNYLYISTDGLVIDPTAGGISAQLSEPNSNVNGNLFYNGNVTISILEVYENAQYNGTKQEVAEELGIYSGIASVDYKIEVLNADGSVKASPSAAGNLYTFTPKDPDEIKFSELVKELKAGTEGFTDTIVVDGEMFNYDNVRVTISVTDNAGTTAQKEFKFHINSTPPKMKIEAIGNPANVAGERGYFGEERKVKVTITDRANTFDASAFKVTISEAYTFDESGRKVELSEEAKQELYSIDKWTDEANATHITYITFKGDINYSWSASYTNISGLSAPSYNDEGIPHPQTYEVTGQTPFDFTVDTTKPTASVTVGIKVWYALLETITFGIFNSTTYNVSITAKDLTSPIKEVKYFKTDATTRLVVDEIEGWNVLKSYDNSGEFYSVDEDITIKITDAADDPYNDQFVVYVRVTDMAGNVLDICSDGAIVDNKAPEIELIAKNAPQVNDIYTSDLEITVEVNDNLYNPESSNAYYSGLQLVTYQIGFDTDHDNKLEGDEVVKGYGSKKNPGADKGILFGPVEIDENAKPKKEKLTATRSESFTISAADFNGCNVMVNVTAVDNAGNTRTVSEVTYVKDETEITVQKLDFDITAPVVNIEYDKNNPLNDKYFGDARTAAVTVTERTNHFKFDNGQMNVYLNPADAEDTLNGIIIKAVDANGNPADATLYWLDEKILVVDDHTSNAAVTTLKIEDDKWSTAEPVIENPADVNNAQHTLKLQFKADANYTVSVNYKDKADHPVKTILFSEGTVAGNIFTVDKTAPTGSITVTAESTKITETDIKSESGETTKETETGDKVSTTSEPYTIDATENTNIIYTLYANEQITFTQAADDATSPIEQIFYCTTSTNVAEELAALTAEELLDESRWTALDIGERYNADDAKEIQTITPDTKAVVYLKIVDFAGNTTYIRTDGLIADKNAPKTETDAPMLGIEADTEAAVNNIYSSDVVIKVTASDKVDPEKDEIINAYSGLKSITYTIRSATGSTDGVLFNNEINGPADEWVSGNGNGYIVVDSETHNSNDVVVEVYAQDNALNTKRVKMEFMIDITPPDVSVTFDPETGDSENTSYFNSNRTATITVTERNILDDDVNEFIKMTVTNADGTTPSLSSWTKTEGTEANGDDTTYTATLEFTADGDYEFSIDSLEDAAGNATEIDLSALKAEFTIDQTVPTVSVSYDNNTAQNDKYFNATRTATITVTEHNFQESRAEATITASLSGSSVTTPSVSWSSSGDTHTGTVNYSSDADYTFEIQVTDMAGNQDSGADYGSSVAAQDFTVDTTIDEIVITGVENGISYKDEAIPSISFSDVNFQDYDVTLHRTRVAEKDKDVEAEYLIGMSEDGSGFSGTFDTFDVTKTENDGLYTLYAEASDLAGNTTSKTVLFTLNRFGSVYVFNNDLIDLLKKEYRRNLINETTGAEYNLVITEYNPDKLVEDSLDIVITHDGSPLDNVICTVNPVINDLAPVGESGWYQYDYNISLDNFRILSKACPNCGREYAEQEDAGNDAEQVTYVNCTECAVELDADSQVIDGIYKITVASQDAAGNRPETTSDEKYEMLFRLDSTKPEITSVIGLEKKIINADTQKIDFEIFDAIGLRSVTMMVDGEAVVNPTEEEIARQISYSGSYTVSTGLNQKISFIIEDMAGNITDTDEKNEDDEYVFNPDYLFERDLSVSTKWYERWYADRTVFWGSIAGAVCLAAAFIILISHFRKKKKATKAK